jgi:catechol 2,3-dioxygenase-like lactoylglutathione lyase family enzyme
MRAILCLLLLATPALAEEPPITRLAGVSFTVADLNKARQFYTELFGFEESFDLKDATCRIESAFFKINDDQYVEFSPGDIENFRLDRVTLLTNDLQAVTAVLKSRNIAAGEPSKAADGTEFLSIRDPDRVEVRFVRYLPVSKQAQHRGKGLGEKRISDHLHHVALAADNESASMALFKEALGMREFSRGGPAPGDVRWINLSVPGSSGDLLEFMVMASQPAAARQHIGFEVSDIQRTFKQLTEHGLKQQNRPFAAAIGRWIWFIRDPNNIRIEFMGQATEKQETK